MEDETATTSPAPATGNRRTFPVGLVLLLFMAGAYLLASLPGPPLEGWGEDLTVALEEAAADDRNVLVVFQLPGCPPCRRMERSVLPNEKVKQALAGFVPVRIDLSAVPDIGDRYQVWGTPTYLVLDSKGRLLARDSGYRSVDEFVTFLSRAGA